MIARALLAPAQLKTFRPVPATAADNDIDQVKQEPAAVAPAAAMDEDDMPPAALIISDSGDEAAQKKKLLDTLSFSFPGGSLASALAKVKTDEDLLSQSCYPQIRMDKGSDEWEDDELTSLAWLQDSNLLKNISSTRLCPSPPESEDDFTDDDYESGKENDSLNGSFNLTSPTPHPSHIPYNPQKHINSKPPYSFSCLIFMAIEDCPEKKLPVKDIYSWILGHFPYFQNAPTGWKNSVRHNLSLNKCFQKVDKDKTSNIGKGSYWCIDPDYRPNLLQALRKTPYHPYHQLQMMSTTPLSCYTTPQKLPFISRMNGGSHISPHLFPFLSRRLNNGTSSNSLDTDIDVANALVSLKKSPFSSHNPRLRSLNVGGGRRSRSPSPPEFGSVEDRRRQKKRTMSPIIITEVPSADHTYSAATTPYGSTLSPASSSIDGEYEFGGQQKNAAEFDSEEEELMSGDEFDSAEEDDMNMEVDPKIINGKDMEGVNALLNLSSIATSVMSDVTKGTMDSSLSDHDTPVSTA